MTAGGAEGQARFWAAETKHGFYTAIEAPVTDTPASAARRLVAALKGHMIAARPSAFPGVAGTPALRFWFATGAQRNGAGVFLAAGKRFYGLIALTDPAEEAMAARFLASLAIPASAKAGESLSAQDSAIALSSAGAALIERVALELLVPRSDPVAASASPTPQPQQIALAEVSETDDLPDPHADLRGSDEPRRSPPKLGAAPLAKAPAEPPPVTPRRTLVPVDPLPASVLEDPPSPRALQPAPPSIAGPTAGASYAPPPPLAHRIWLPGAWRWNGYYWEWLPGHWNRAQS
jgi:hypothetical protein